MTEVKKAYEDYEDRHDASITYMLVGWLCWIFGFLVMFFNPAAIRMGKFTLVGIAVVLAVVGLGLNIIGYVRLRKT